MHSERGMMISVTKPMSKIDFRIHPGTRLGHVHLSVADLDRQIEF